jgi:hypothetical protein
MIEASVPDLLGVLESARLWSGAETHIDHSLYERIPSLCFSQRVLSVETGRLAVFRLNDVGWSDLGDPGRAYVAAREAGCESQWMEYWGVAKSVPAEAVA